MACREPRNGTGGLLFVCITSRMEDAMKSRLLGTALVAASGLILGGWFWNGAALAATLSPIYVHMNGLNDFLPRIVFVKPGQTVVFVNQDQGPHSIHGYNPVGGDHLKDLNDMVLQGTPGPGHAVHTYKVRFNHVGIHYYICTVHAHLVSVYKAPSGQDYFLPAKRVGVHGYLGSMAGVIVVTREKQLLGSNPPITRQKILQKFWNNGDASGR